MLKNAALHVLENRALSQQDGLLILAAEDLCGQAKPGQFVMIQGGRTLDPFLRRAISICDCDQGRLALAYRVVGKGTAFLRSLEAGQEVHVLGPLGRGFQTKFSGSKALLLGGGIGMAPMVFLAKALLAQGKEVHLRIGGQVHEAVKAGETLFKDLACETSVTTDDGSYGVRGLVTEGLPPWESFDQVYACGPTPMLKAVQAACQRTGTPCQLSLEGKMACGVGVCLGCSCDDAHHPDRTHKVCTQGPVFDADEVVL